MNLSEDSDLGTRLIQSRCVRELVSAFNNEPLDVLHDVAPYIRAQLEHSSAQVVASGVVSLAEAARASASVAPIIVAQLVLLSSSPGVRGALARAALQYIAVAVESSAVRPSTAVAALLRRHLRAIVARWVGDGRSLSTFPFELCGEGVSLASLIQHNGSVVIPQVKKKNYKMI